MNREMEGQGFWGFVDVGLMRHIAPPAPCALYRCHPTTGPLLGLGPLSLLLCLRGSLDGLELRAGRIVSGLGVGRSRLDSHR
jgi:hypothetical protein